MADKQIVMNRDSQIDQFTEIHESSQTNRCGRLIRHVEQIQQRVPALLPLRLSKHVVAHQHTVHAKVRTELYFLQFLW